MPSEREKMLAGAPDPPAHAVRPGRRHRLDAAALFCDYGTNIELGKRVFFNFNCVVLDVCRVRVGDYTLFGPGVQILTPVHPMNAELRRREEYGQPIDIGADVWVGGGALILPGVRIGSRTVIGAGSVVTRDVPDGCSPRETPAASSGRSPSRRSTCQAQPTCPRTLRPSDVRGPERGRAKCGAARRRYRFAGYSTVTDLARLRGWSTLHPRATAT
jgi:acetyltransferase-like isoleucine patch superfamily enzyme